jgi:hypothetical protein
MPNARATMPDQISEVVGAAAEGEAEGGVVFQAVEAIGGEGELGLAARC